MRVLLVIVLAVSLSAATASAADRPCWKQLIEDWYDGPFDNTYRCACYREALRHLPVDTGSYSTAKRDIARELRRCHTRLIATHPVGFVRKPKEERNIPALIVTTVLGIVVVVLLFRRRRKPPSGRPPSA